MDLVFTPDGQFLVTVDDHGELRLSDPDTGIQVFTLVEDGPPHTCVAASPNGKFLAVGDAKGVVRLWDLESRSLQAEWDSNEQHRVEKLAFYQDGALLAVQFGNLSAALFNALSGERLGALRDLEGHVRAFAPSTGFGPLSQTAVPFSTQLDRIINSVRRERR